MKRLFPSVFALFVLLFSFLFVNSKFKIKNYIKAVPPTSVKDVLSSSQLSYFARVGADTTAPDTTVKIQLSGNPSNTTSNLFVGDTVAIANTGATDTLTSYTISDIGNTATFSVSSALSANNDDAGLAIIATRSAIHTIHLTPETNITGGAWQVLLKATSRTGENHQDGLPDQQGFDLGQDVGSTTTGVGTRLKNADVSCPWGATASVGTTTVVDSNSYHIITCDLGVGITSAEGVGVTITIGRDLATGSQLINPAPALSHTEGQANSTADTYTFYVRHLDESDSVVVDDTLPGIIAVVESVRVTADIDPTLTFIIDATNLGSGDSACGVTLGSAADNTTPVSASFGSLSLGQFNDLAHRLSCVTNAPHGYVVTVYQNGYFTNFTSGNGETIPDTDCDGACDYNTVGAWDTDSTNSGWGYSIQNINVGQTVFSYDIGATFAAKAFGQGSAQAQDIFKNPDTPTSTERAYICYRLVASTAQTAGSYETQLVYTATATF